MYFDSVFIGILMTFCISNIQAKPFLYNAYQDDDFGDDFVDYFIDVDTSRTPTLRVNPFSLPANNESAVSRAENDDSSFDIIESPVAYAESFELAFDEAAERLEKILRLAVKKFKESFIQSFGTIYNSSAIEEITNNSINANAEQVITNITSSIVDVNKEKENENKIEEHKTNVIESENNENTVEDNTIKVTVQAKPAVDHNVAAIDIKSAINGSTTVDNVVKLENEIKKKDNELMPNNELIPANEIKPDVQKVEAESSNANENKQE